MAHVLVDLTQGVLFKILATQIIRMVRTAVIEYAQSDTRAAFKIRGSPPYSDHGSASKMAASIGGCHLQAKEQF